MKTDSIAKRLRELAWGCVSGPVSGDILAEAADYIESLEQELQAITLSKKYWVRRCEKFEAGVKCQAAVEA